MRSPDVEDAICALDEGAADYVAQQNLVRLSWTIERAVRTEGERRRHIEVLQDALSTSKERFHALAETTGFGNRFGIIENPHFDQR